MATGARQETSDRGAAGGAEAEDGQEPGARDAATGDAGAPLGEEAFVGRANAICRSAKREGREQEPRQGSMTLAAILKLEVEKIESLGPPADDAETIEELLGELRTAIEIIESGKNLKQAGRHFLRAEELAKRYGLDSCLVI